MPFLPPDTAQTAIFLYESEEHAQARVKWGGSGLLVGVPSIASEDWAHLYAVSNEHVANSYRVIRAMLDSGPVILNKEQRAWIPHPDGDDVSILPLGAYSQRDITAWPSFGFVTREALGRKEDGKYGPGPGDECLMIGRYVNHRGEQFDQPLVRFGNLSMLPEPVWQRLRGHDQESFLVDMRSAPGFSGSQVLLYYGQTGPRVTEKLPYVKDAFKHDWSEVVADVWLLGINWGHLPSVQKARELLPEDAPGEPRTIRLELDSTVAAVVPAWKITEMLEGLEDIVKPRERVDEEIATGNETDAVLDIEDQPDGSTEPDDEFSRFEDLTRRLVNTPKPKPE